MTKSKNIISKILSAILVIATIFHYEPSVASVKADNIDITIDQEKIHCNASIDDDFADNKVIVILNQQESAKLNDYNSKQLLDINGIKIRDLTSETRTMLKNRQNYSVESNCDDMDCSELSGRISKEDFRQILSLELDNPGKENVLKLIKELEKRDEVLYAGPDYHYYHDTTIPNDQKYTSQWSLTKIKAPQAWDITTGTSTVLVGIVDSGINGTHDDLKNRINMGLCRDFTGDNTVTSNPPVDSSGHGTHVAGIVGAQGNNGIGISGICWGIRLVSLRVSVDSNNPATTSRIISAIDYSISKSIPILNMSLGNYFYDEALKASCAMYPGLIVCSAGNSHIDVDVNNHYPSGYNLPNIISVANSDENDALSASSNYGETTVHLAAPGSRIISTYINSQGYESLSGTSMAAPHVTGVAALIRSVNSELTAPEIKKLILDNVDYKTDLLDKCITGGRLNAYRAVRAATEPQTFTGDVNGDGKDDIIMSRAINGKRAFTVYLGQSNGKFGDAKTTTSTRNFIYGDPAFIGDFNGDGRTDIVIMWTNGIKRQLLVYTGKADGTFNEGANLSSTRNNVPVEYPANFHIADVNGDGKDDFVVQYRNSNGKRYALVYKGKSTSPYLTDATTNALQSTYDYKYNSTVMMGDMNKDGKADMVIYCPVDTATSLRQIIVYTGTANGTFNEGAAITAPAGYLSHLSTPCKVFIADQNGDGYDDVVVHFANNNGKRCTIVYKGKSASPYVNNTPAYALSSTNNFVDEDPVLIADVNGDGRDDMIVIYAISGKRRILIYTAKANEKYNTGTVMSSTQPLSNVYFPCFNYIADVNGDGRDDLVVKLKNGNNVKFLTYLGTSSGTFNEAVETIPATNIPFYIAS